MALCFPAAVGACNLTRLRMPPRSHIPVRSSSIAVVSGRAVFQCMAADIKTSSDRAIVRRSANHQPPPMWGYDYVQSLRSEYDGESNSKRLEKLKKHVRMMLDEVADPLHQLELIDDLQRLGISYHFQEEIEKMLGRIYNHYRNNHEEKHESLYAVALKFRLLRQHGYDIPLEIFSRFKDETGKFKSSLGVDYKGLLSLYEAAFLLKEGESSMFHDARNFTTTYLKEYVNRHNKDDDDYLSTLVNRALELPLHYRIVRSESRWFIDVYERRQAANPILLDLAKLDFNIVQAIHQQDLKFSSKWWNSSGLIEKLSFARDRLVEYFLWNVGTLFQPQFQYCRIMITKLIALITVMDDVYDAYGTLDELERFTDAVERWDLNAIEQLPDHIRVAFLAIHNFVNEIAVDAVEQQGPHMIHCLRREWAKLCKSYVVEAKWYNSGYIPALEEYIENALVSVGGPLVLVHAYFFIPSGRKEAPEFLQEYQSIFYSASMIIRYANDLGASTEELERGDVHKSIQCYMDETGASEEEARKHVQELIESAWMKMNKDRAESRHLSETLIDYSMNLARMAQYMYQYGGGHGVEDRQTKDRVLSLLVNPFPVGNRDDEQRGQEQSSLSYHNFAQTKRHNAV